MQIKTPSSVLESKLKYKPPFNLLNVQLKQISLLIVNMAYTQFLEY